MPDDPMIPPNMMLVARSNAPPPHIDHCASTMRPCLFATVCGTRSSRVIPCYSWAGLEYFQTCKHDLEWKVMPLEEIGFEAHGYTNLCIFSQAAHSRKRWRSWGDPARIGHRPTKIRDLRNKNVHSMHLHKQALYRWCFLLSGVRNCHFQCSTCSTTNHFWTPRDESFWPEIRCVQRAGMTC